MKVNIRFRFKRSTEYAILDFKIFNNFFNGIHAANVISRDEKDYMFLSFFSFKLFLILSKNFYKF